jgi:uncharacterized SAM-binding protein YcdF (DUF218 family)
MIKRLLLLIVVLLIAGVLAAPAAGRWLVVQDVVQPARAIVVLGGHVPLRAMEAAELYRAGASKEVWVTQAEVFVEDEALERLGIKRPREHEYSRQVLLALKVPVSAIQVLPERNVNTAEELRSVAGHLRQSGGGSVIFVTSKLHTRRVRIIWDRVADGAGEATVRYTPDDPFDPNRWWRNTRDAMDFTREWFGIFNAWAGFPMTSVRS